MTSPADTLRNASRYPYDPPAFSYRFAHDADAPRRAEVRHLAVTRESEDSVPLVDIAVLVEGQGERRYERRVPVLASGSNASFERLRSKFAEAGDKGDFPVMRASVAGIVAVYSAHVSIYGAVPGTVTHERGAVSRLHIAFLNVDELRRLNASEGIGLEHGNYALGLLGGIDAELAPEMRLPAALAYVSKRGAFAPDGGPVRIDAFEATGSRHPAAPQADMLRAAQRHLGETGPLEEFVHGHVADPELRRARIAAMRSAAHACDIPGLRMLTPGIEAPRARLPAGFESLPDQ